MSGFDETSRLRICILLAFQAKSKRVVQVPLWSCAKSSLCNSCLPRGLCVLYFSLGPAFIPRSSMPQIQAKPLWMSGTPADDDLMVLAVSKRIRAYRKKVDKIEKIEASVCSDGKVLTDEQKQLLTSKPSVVSILQESVSVFFFSIFFTVKRRLEKLRETQIRIVMKSIQNVQWILCRSNPYLVWLLRNSKRMSLSGKKRGMISIQAKTQAQWILTIILWKSNKNKTRPGASM